MMSVAGASSVNALPDPFSMIVCMMFVEVEAILLGAETMPATGSVNIEVMTGTSGIVTVVAFEMTTARTDFTVLSSAFEV